jgi:hypothetical protein
MFRLCKKSKPVTFNLVAITKLENIETGKNVIFVNFLFIYNIVGIHF